ncbi:MAG: glycoside hydrolase family 36 protein [Pseudomonadota bacterium]
MRSLLLPSLLLLTACPAPQDTAAPPCGDLRVDAADGEVSFGRDGCAAAVLAARMVGQGDLTLELAVDGRILTPTITAGPGGATLRALVLEGTAEVAGEEPLRWWRQGYQSWSWAGVVETGDAALDADGLPVVGGQGVPDTFLRDTAASSWWVGLLGRPEGGALLLGALGAETLPWYAAADEGGSLWAVWGGFDEENALAGGASVVLDPLWLGVGDDASALLEGYAEAVGAAAPREAPALGWSSWYAFYAEVTEEQVRANLAAAAALNDRGDLAPIELLQVDDGWARAWGDWEANERFPSGMAALAEDIAAAGLRPGLWLAPFYVHRQAPAYVEHPGWWVLDVSGAELAFDNDGTGDYAVLDVTVPEAAAWLQGVIAARVAEGWTYLKLDFLYAGALPGLRHEAVTGLEAYRRGVALLREAAGEGAFIVACGAPVLPSVGFADGFRTGADIAYGWSPDPDPAYLRWQARNTAGRAWMNGRWWWNDPDVLLLRAPFSELQARGAVAAQVASGGLWLLGDDLTALPEERLALALHPAATASRGRLVRPAHPLSFPSGHDLGPVAERQVPDDRAPPAWRLEGGITVLLDLGEEPLVLPAPGGTELLTGEESAPGGARILEPGEGEVWEEGEVSGTRTQAF